MAEAKASGVALPEPTPSITQKIAGSKTVRVAGVTGALILASDLASAAEEGVASAKQGDRQMATGYLTDILGALTGPVGFTASQLFGTSPDELRTLRAAEQARKAGVGRGVAPSIDELIGLVNQGKGGLWVGMAVMSGLSSLIGFLTHLFLNKS